MSILHAGCRWCLLLLRVRVVSFVHQHPTRLLPCRNRDILSQNPFQVLHRHTHGMHCAPKSMLPFHHHFMLAESVMNAEDVHIAWAPPNLYKVC